MRDKNLKLTTKQRNKGICKHLTEHYFENFCFPVGPFLIIIHTIPKKSKKCTKMKYLLTYLQRKLKCSSTVIECTGACPEGQFFEPRPRCNTFGIVAG